jgi:hypothetical protein
VELIKELPTLMASTNRYWFCVFGSAAVLCACTQDVGPWPDVPVKSYRIVLARNGCLATCPDYKVVIDGNGRVTFTGREFVNFVGTKTYFIPRDEVSGLIRDIKRFSILDAKADYGAPVDAPTCVITIDGGVNRKDVWTVCGHAADVPEGVRKFQDRIDEVGRTAQFQLTSKETDQARILSGEFEVKLERSKCYGTCPSYSVSVNQDGEVEYTGREFVKVFGAKKYTIPKEDAVALARDFLALRDTGVKDEYSNNVTDMPTYRVSMRIDDFTRSIVDYDGYQVGMPTSVSQLQIRIDKLTGSYQFLKRPPFEVPTGPRGYRQPLDVTVEK